MIGKDRVIGVVGGVGPFAGLDLQQKIAAQTMAQKDQDHVTVLSVSRPSTIPDRTEYLQGVVAENPAKAIAEQIQLLAKMGADLVGIPCNTAHSPRIINQIQAELESAPCQIHLLHMIEEVGRFLQENYPEIRRVGILSTTGTYQTAVYPQVLGMLGFTVVTPNLTMQEELIHPAIYHPQYGIKSCGFVTEQARQSLLAGIAACQAQGAEAVVLGCTEIPLAISEQKVGETVMIDPTLILARALIRELNPAKLRPLPF